MRAASQRGDPEPAGVRARRDDGLDDARHAALGLHVSHPEHADRIAVRIVQLGGAPDLNPASLTTRSHSQYTEGTTLVEMIKEDLIAERIAIDIYREIIKYLGEDDSTTRRLMEEILEKEEEHADELSNMSSQLDSHHHNGKE